MNDFWASIKSFFTGTIPPSNERKEIEIQCVAIDQCGDLGSIYNRCEEIILGKLKDKVKSQSCVRRNRTMCKLYHGRTGESQNLLKMVLIDQQMRLSIVLKRVQPTAIASIINYPRSVDTYTRFLHFWHETRVDYCHKDLLKRKNMYQFSNLHRTATHVITQIVWGIDAVVVLQLSHDTLDDIDKTLEEIRANLERQEQHLEMTPKVRDLLNQVTSTTVYSNIPTLSQMTDFNVVWQKILEIRNKTDEHRRMIYILTPIPALCSEENFSDGTNVAFNKDQIENFENSLLQRLSEFRKFQIRLDHELPELLQGKLDERLNAARQHFFETKKLFDNTLLEIGALLVRLRGKEDVMSSIQEILNSDVQKTIEDYTRQLTTVLDKLTSKGNLIKHLQNDGFTYHDVAKLGIDKECSESVVRDILFKNDHNKRIFCATDDQKLTSNEQWDTLYFQMMRERQNNTHLTLIYADFTYTKYILTTMMILSPKEQASEQSQSTAPVKSREHKRQTSKMSPIADDEYINILLLGESGVGKSTFINAFANYLRYETLQQAASNKPFVIIPVSFLMTFNDSFDEELVKFGEPDPNEDHSNSGQSVTQQCRSYVFAISHGKKLRIIDTPGFGDTRGLDQDDLNMEIIFSFVHHLTYLNGVCVLFKPNNAQLNPFLYSCYTQLFQFFGENIRNYLIFCFTNARSTFFTPGDTRPLLKTFFESFPVKEILLEKRNTFCFDSESFRYLVALQKSLTIQEIERDEIEKSWIRSVDESKRFERYLCRDIRPYRKTIEWQSVQEVQFQINSMLRPMLETMRNVLRNILLHSIHSAIELKATFLNQVSVICNSPDRQLEKFGPCYILLDRLHPSSSQCAFDQHRSATYRLEYEYLNNKTNESLDQFNEQQAVLCHASAQLACFLAASLKKQDDPFFYGLARLADEENLICQKENQSVINHQLRNELKKLKDDYQKVNKTYSTTGIKSLSDIYELVQSVKELPMVKIQMDAVNQYHQFLLTANEQNSDEDTRWY